MLPSKHLKCIPQYHFFQHPFFARGTVCVNSLPCNFSQITYNHFQNILKLFQVLPNLPFTKSEMMRNYYLQTWYIQVASGVAKRLKT